MPNGYCKRSVVVLGAMALAAAFSSVSQTRVIQRHTSSDLDPSRTQSVSSYAVQPPGSREQPASVGQQMAAVTPELSFVNETASDFGQESASFCGSSMLAAFGVSIRAHRHGDTVSFTLASTNTTDVVMYGRAVGPSLVGLSGQRSHDTVSFSVADAAMWTPGDYQVDVLATWIGDRFLGQRWELPNRNDNPPFDEKKRKCTALKLSGSGCERFGVSLWRATLRVNTPKRSVKRACAWEGDGEWVPAPGADALLDDPVGLNRFGGVPWKWVPFGCGEPYRSRKEVEVALANARVQKLALFGDSMLVEQFHMLHNFLAPNSAIVQGKNKRLRSMEFKSDTLHVKFFRSYTTGGGHSIIASPATIVSQIASFSPDVVVGNAAVLHWQQNMRSEADWKRNVVDLHARFTEALSRVRTIYFGPTLIQMGRTQGLQPQRTAAFAAIAQQALRSWEFFNPAALSIPRRESAFDGQHWACYHTFGGVSHTISQLLLRRVAP
uniref:Uncharacterized protein n=1 Tax=Neobodo designis TaxID=312471 RepID=A0A7S1PT30_NEODS